MLIIDPDCAGALLRAQGEGREDPGSEVRLEIDVKRTEDALLSKKDLARGRKGDKVGCKVQFDFRFYRTAPTVFLIRTNRASYIQQYYFWAKHDDHTAFMPIIRCTDATNYHLHQGMLKHFEHLWKSASIGAEARMKGASKGIDRSLGIIGAVNMFHKSETGRDRIAYLLGTTARRLWLMGVTLHSFFDARSNHATSLYALMAGLMQNSRIDVRILLLDPTSEQACYRAYRESQSTLGGISFADYQASNELRKTSQLCTDFAETVVNIKRIPGLSPYVNV